MPWPSELLQMVDVRLVVLRSAGDYGPWARSNHLAAVDASTRKGRRSQFSFDYVVGNQASWAPKLLRLGAAARAR